MRSDDVGLLPLVISSDLGVHGRAVTLDGHRSKFNFGGVDRDRRCGLHYTHIDSFVAGEGRILQVRCERELIVLRQDVLGKPLRFDRNTTREG